MAAGRIIRKELIPTKSSLFPHDRDRIHLLTLLRRTSGLSPPEEEELALLEGREAEKDQTFLYDGEHPVLPEGFMPSGSFDFIQGDDVHA